MKTLVLKVIRGADYIFAGHSHHDHIGDVPFIAKASVPRYPLENHHQSRVDGRGGQVTSCHDTRRREIRASKNFPYRLSKAGTDGTEEDPYERKTRRYQAHGEVPIRGSDFVDGGSYLYYFTFGKHRVLHQSTGNLIEEKLTGVGPDFVLIDFGATRVTIYPER